MMSRKILFVISYKTKRFLTRYANSLNFGNFFVSSEMGNLGSIEKVLFGNKVLYLKRLVTLAYGSMAFGERLVTCALGLWAMALNGTLNG